MGLIYREKDVKIEKGIIMKNVIIHAGAPKTGTSFLQTLVFPFLNNVYYAGPSTKKEDIFDELHRIIRYRDPLFFDLTSIKKKINTFLLKTKEKNIVFSHEDLAGKLITGFQFAPFYANLIKELFPGAKIFFVFRKQDDYVQSAFYQCVIKRNIDAGIHKFIAYEERASLF